MKMLLPTTLLVSLPLLVLLPSLFPLLMRSQQAWRVTTGSLGCSNTRSFLAREETLERNSALVTKKKVKILNSI